MHVQHRVLLLGSFVVGRQVNKDAATAVELRHEKIGIEQVDIGGSRAVLPQSLPACNRHVVRDDSAQVIELPVGQKTTVGCSFYRCPTSSGELELYQPNGGIDGDFKLTVAQVRQDGVWVAGVPALETASDVNGFSGRCTGGYSRDSDGQLRKKVCREA